LVRPAAYHSRNVPGANEGVETHVRRIQNGPDSRDDRHMVAEDRKIPYAFGLRSHHGKRRGRRRSLETDGKKHYMLIRIEAGKLQSVGWRIYNPNVHSTRFVLERAALGSGDAHHIAKGS